MTKPHDLDELAARCEKATGANKMLDEAIYEALDIRPSRHHSFVYPHYAFTASLDAAMTLVPEGWHLSDLCENWLKRTWKCDLAKLPSEGQRRAYESGNTIGIDSERSEGAATPALALTAAALRARASLTRSLGGG